MAQTKKQLPKLSPMVPKLKTPPPKLGAPKIQSPKMETPKLGHPKIGTPKLAEPKTEAPKLGHPEIQGPKMETPKLEHPKIGSPTAFDTPDSPTHHMTQTELSAYIKSPYQVVSPVSRFGSWINESDIPMSRIWWEKRHMRQKWIVLFEVIACFTLIIVALLVMIGFGAHMLAQRRWSQQQLDARLKSKTNLCRAKYARRAECVHESEDGYGRCSGSLCVETVWEFVVGKRGVWSIDYKDTNLNLNETDYADCGDLKWCLKGACVPSGVKSGRWWSSRPAFPKAGKFEWIEKSRYNLSCFEIKNRSMPTFANLLSWYYDHCNDSLCSNPAVKYGLRIRLHHCDTSQDPTTGARKLRCKDSESLIKLFNCYPCRNYDPKNSPRVDKDCVVDGEKTDSNRQHVFWPDGAPCTTTRGHNGACLMGVCSEIHEETANT